MPDDSIGDHRIEALPILPHFVSRHLRRMSSSNSSAEARVRSAVDVLKASRALRSFLRFPKPQDIGFLVLPPHRFDTGAITVMSATVAGPHFIHKAEALRKKSVLPKHATSLEFSDISLKYCRRSEYLRVSHQIFTFPRIDHFR